MKKYSQYLFVAFLAFVLIPMSCNEDNLDQINSNAVSEDLFWKTADDVSVAVNGMYHPITNTFFWGRIIHTGALLRSDAFNVRPFGPNTAMSTLQGAPGASRWSTEIWGEPYKCIFRANSILEFTNATNVTDEDLRNSYIGQAHFMRGFAYWYLVNLYGKVPVITTNAKTPDGFYPSQSDVAAVWTQIEADFDMASKLLPEAYEGNDIGRPTKYSAMAFKAKSHLYQGEWGEAITGFEGVINSQKYDLLPADQYKDNFTEDNENNMESVYEIQFLGQSAFAWGVDIPGTGNMGNFHLDYSPPTKSLDQSHYVNTWVRELFEANGEVVRRNATLAYDYDGSTGYGGLPFREDFIGELELARTEEMDSVYSRKYAGMDIGVRDDVDGLGTNVGNNWRLIRYADVLLMYAEALNEDNQTGLAEMYLNMVRERAMVDPKTGLSQEDMRQAIIDERVLELTGEGHRFFDLVRWGLADDYMGATSLHGSNPKSLSGGIFETGQDEYLWIPANEMSANENLVQNPGY